MTLKFQAKMIGISDGQVLEHFKEAFLPKIQVQQSKINYIDTIIGKARALVLLFKPNLPKSTCSFVLAHMIDRNDNTEYAEKVVIQIKIHFMKLFAKLESI